MRSIFFLSSAISAAALVSGCSPASDALAIRVGGQASEAAANVVAAAARGKEFAVSHCASCHAVTAGTSPNGAAPAFADVINDPELTAATLTPWLRNSHNFPEIMAFEISPEHIEDLAAHMLSLKDPHYRPRI